MEIKKTLEQLAELVYLEKPETRPGGAGGGRSNVKFVDLNSEQKNRFYTVAQKIVSNIDKMNLKLVAKGGDDDMTAEQIHARKEARYNHILDLVFDWRDACKRPVLKDVKVPWEEIARQIGDFIEGGSQVEI